MALCCCVARLATGRMVIIYIYYLQSTAWENIYNDLFSQQRGPGSAVQGWEPLRWRIERKRRCPVQCPVSSVRLVQTTEDTPLIYCVNLNMQIRSSGALIRALWIIMNVLQPGVMKVTHFLAMYFVCLVALSLRWYNWCNATWHLALLDNLTRIMTGAHDASQEVTWRHCIHQPPQCQAASFLPYTDMGRINCTQHTWSHVGGGSGTHSLHADLALHCSVCHDVGMGNRFLWMQIWYVCNEPLLLHKLWLKALLTRLRILASMCISNSNPNF